MSDRHWILAFDASTPSCVAALGWVDDAAQTCAATAVIAEQPNQASARLADGLAELLASAGIAATQLAAVACGRGPGTFTGTRVALATAMGVALGADARALPLSTLQIVAASAPLDRGHDGQVVAWLDARRAEVYAARITVGRSALGERTLTPVGDEACSDPAAWLSAQADLAGATVIGPGVAPYRELVDAAGLRAVPCEGPTVQGLWATAVAAWRRGDATDPGQLRAVYLRRSYAELGVNKPKRGFSKSPFV